MTEQGCAWADAVAIRDAANKAQTNQVIPAEAVEAAAKALYPEVREGWRAPPDPWESLAEDDEDKIWARALARLALESAAPHMLRTVWDEAYGKGWDAARGEPDTPNPYEVTA